MTRYRTYRAAAVSLTETIEQTKSLREGAKLRRLRDAYEALAAKELAPRIERHRPVQRRQ